MRAFRNGKKQMDRAPATNSLVCRFVFSPITQNSGNRFFQLGGLRFLPKALGRFWLHPSALELNHPLVFWRTVTANRARDGTCI